MMITVGFSRAKDWWLIGSKAIAAIEKRPYSHAFIKYESSMTGMELIAQASHGCINAMNYERFLSVNTVVKEYEFDISPDDFTFMMDYIETNLGTPYSRLQIFLLALKKIFKIEVNIHNKDEAFICSEFIARILEIIGIIPKIEDTDYLTPSDLDTLLQNREAP